MIVVRPKGGRAASQVSASDSVEEGGARENNLYVKNLPAEVDDARLERMFNVKPCELFAILTPVLPALETAP